MTLDQLIAVLTALRDDTSGPCEVLICKNGKVVADIKEVATYANPYFEDDHPTFITVKKHLTPFQRENRR